MRRVANLIFMIVCAIVGAWLGYWLGYLAGWATDAEWPAHMGGGAGAMALAIVVAFLGVALSAVAISIGPYLRSRRLLQRGVPARAKVIQSKRVGLTLRSFNEVYEEVRCDLEVQSEDQPPFHTRACQFAPQALEAALRPGAVVDIRYDPAKPARAVVVALPRRKTARD